MIESLIIALREGIEVALVLGILIAYLKTIQHSTLIKSVYSGFVLAILASIGGAILLQKFTIDHESFEGFLMLVAALFVISMIIWMWVTAKKIRKEIQKKVDNIVEHSAPWQAHIGIFMFTFLIIIREGIETAIFLQAVALSTGAWHSIVGTILGLSCATMFAILFIRGSTRIDIPRFLKVTAITLLIFTFQLILNAFHEFYEYGIFPANPQMMGILGPIVQNNTLFILAIISIPALMLIIPGKKKASMPAATLYRRWQLSAGIVSMCLVFFLGMGEVFSTDYSMDLSSQWIDVPQGDLIKIPLSSVGDGKIHRYSIKDQNLEIRFFILRTGLGKFVTAFDACYACYSYGKYYLKKGELICSLCDAPSSLSILKAAADEPEPDAENSGSMEGNGCSPIYLPSKIENGNVVIGLNDLRKKRKYFDITEE
ncbi:MAG: DUF2318 domain-containing protein [Ignavibacteriae bacterium]|nr:DUF2318 domain-containing protein [Ignavibacteriota bacterium]